MSDSFTDRAKRDSAQQASPWARSAEEFVILHGPDVWHGGIDWGVGQSPDFGLGHRRGLLHGVLWALCIEAVIAGLVVLIVKVV